MGPDRAGSSRGPARRPGNRGAREEIEGKSATRCTLPLSPSGRENYLSPSALSRRAGIAIRCRTSRSARASGTARNRNFHSAYVNRLPGREICIHTTS